MVARVRQQETDLLRELRQKRDQKLEKLMKETETVGFYIAKAHSLQVTPLGRAIVNLLLITPNVSGKV